MSAQQDEFIARALVRASYAKAAARDAVRQTQQCAREVGEWSGEGHPEARAAFAGVLESAGDLLVSALSKLDKVDRALEGLLRAHNGKEEKS